MRHIIGYGGGKGGGGGRTPVETPDSLHSIAFARVLDLLSEGEIRGLVNGMQSVYLNGTPLVNPDGSSNFQNVSVAYQYGTQHQEYIPGFPAVENEKAVGVDLTASQPWTQEITNTQLSAVRVRLAVLALSKANTSNGDIGGYRVEYAIDVATDNGTYQEVRKGAFDGKTTNKYERSERIDLPPATSRWRVRVRRLTPNANSNTIADTTRVESYTEIIDAKLRYPNSAIVGLQVDARQFNNVPTRAYDTYGRILRVPSNYDPESRTYVGLWDGTFKVAWTDNPAWVFYDLVLHPVYGLGDRINASMIDKWSLYQIAQYCDQLVPDGRGGQEPRFTCNLYLQARGEAYKVLQDVASIFRGMAYWAGGMVVANADMPGDPVYTFTAANVIEGRFTYAGSSRRARKTVALVSWNDPANAYRAKVEPVQDPDGVARYGIQQTEVTAFGCTSQSQAQRLGQWMLLTSRLETETVTFKVALEAANVAPGSLIQVADPARAGRRIGGRVRSAAGRTVTLDKADGVAQGDTLTVVLPSGVAQTRTVFSVAGDVITVSADWSEPVKPESAWAIESATLKTQLFRVLTVSEVDDLICEITALKHEPGKFAAIDTGARIDPRPVTVIPPSVQPPPTDVGFSTYSIIDQGIASTVMVISWTPAEKAIAYEVEWRRDGGDWISAGRTGSQNVEVRGIYAGRYVARIRAINALDVASVPAYSVETVLQGKTSPPPVLASLTTTGLIFGIRLDWAFPPGPLDVERTEIWYGQVNDREQAVRLGDFAFPLNTHTMMGLAAGVTFYFWARLVDKSGNIGAWYPAGAGVMGQSSASATDILDYLNGQIGKTQLAGDLLSSIESIAPPFAGSDEDYAGSEEIFAGIVSTQSVLEEADMALAQQITTLQATVGSSTAAVQTIAQSVADQNGKLAAMYTIKTQITQDGRTYLAGIGVGVENNGGVVESQVLVAADRFAVIHPNGTGVLTPFVIQNGQTFINQAFIGDGTITNAKIGEVIQSNSIGANGQPRWRLDKGGTLTINGPNAGAGYLTITDSQIRVFDGNGTLRVRLGIW